jgi:hypothetical protein
MPAGGGNSKKYRRKEGLEEESKIENKHPFYYST